MIILPKNGSESPAKTTSNAGAYPFPLSGIEPAMRLSWAVQALSSELSGPAKLLLVWLALHDGDGSFRYISMLDVIDLLALPRGSTGMDSAEDAFEELIVHQHILYRIPHRWNCLYREVTIITKVAE